MRAPRYDAAVRFIWSIPAFRIEERRLGRRRTRVMGALTRSRLVLASTFLISIAAPPVPAEAGWRAEGPAAANVNSVAIAPSRTSTVYAATSGGGVWRSDDGGKTWTLPGDEMTSRDVRWIQVDPADPATVWAGIEPDGSHSAVWRTNDQGATWKPVADSYQGGRVQATGAPISFAPTQPKTIYVASTNLHYRTDDGGKTWRDFRVPNQDAYVFAVDQKDAKIVYAGGRGDTLNLSRSTDAGKTWKQIGVGLGKNSLKHLLIDPGNPNTIYAAGGTFTSIFKSTDQGNEFTELKVPVGATSDLYSLTMDPRNGSVLWAATEDGLLKTTDGGATWSQTDTGSGRYLLKTIAVDPNDSSHLVAGAGGDGIYTSRDGGATWAASSDGLAAGWVEKLWGDPRSATLFAQLATGLFRRDGASWSEITTPFSDGDEVDLDGFVFDAASPQTIYALDTSVYWLSTDGGRGWRKVEQKGPGVRQMMKGSTDSVQFVSMVQDRGNAKVIYTGSWSNDDANGAVYKTVDGGKKWAPSGTGLPPERVDLLRAGSPNTVFALVEDNGLFRTTNGGTSWSAASSGLDGKLRELAVDPKTPSLLYAATEEGLFLSGDAAGSWSKLAAGLEEEDVETVAIDPATSAVYVGTFHGVHRSTDQGKSWTPMRDGLLNQDVRALVVAGTPPRLWAGTAGGSVYSTELP
jgi:photosystem II stability/assembly factor-like uncharacterized protein